jgi:osmoprotectant transport system substrate-binding protein
MFQIPPRRGDGLPGPAGRRSRASMVRRGAALGAVAAACFPAAACGGGKANPLSSSAPAAKPAAKGSVVVGSANFPEDELLAEIYTRALQAKGVKVTTKFNIGTREVYYPEVVKGAITIIPEYNGELLETSVDPASTAASTAQVDAALKAKLPASVAVLDPSPAQDKDSVTVTAATARKDHLTSVGDLGPYAKNMVFGGPPEFRTRANGLPGLRKDYGLTFKAFDPLDESGPVTFAALKSGKVQAADVFTTSPQIQTDHLVPLADPKNNFAAENVIPLVYKKDVTPAIEATLNAISAKLTTAALVEMNKETGIDHEDYSTVAKQWLTREGLG